MSQARATSGWTSPTHPIGCPPTRTVAARPGCRNGSVPGSTDHSTRSASSTAASMPLAAKRVGGSGVARRASSRAAWRPISRAPRTCTSVAGVSGSLGRRRGRRPPISNTPMSAAPRARLCCAASSSDGSCSGAQDRLRLAHRVEQLDDRAMAVVGAQPQPVEHVGLGEAPAGDLVQPAAGEHVLGAAAHALRMAEPGRAQPAPRRQRRRQRLDAVDARDLLDQIGLARDVAAAPVRHGDVEAAFASARRRSRASRGSRPARSRGIGDPEQRCDARLAQRDRHRRRRRRRRRRSCPPTGRAPQISIISALATACASSACCGDSPFSKRPLASLRSPSADEVRLMLGPSQVAASISTRVVPRATSERAPPITPAIDVGPSPSSITTTRSSASASARRASRPSRRRARAGPSAARRDTVGVEGVQRLARQQHHVVGDVDHVADRAHSGGRQSRLEPQRRRADADVFERTQREARAQLGAVDVDADALDRFAGRVRIARPRRLGERRAGDRMDLACDAVDARQSGRFGVISSSSTSVAIGSTSASGVPAHVRRRRAR